RCGASSARVARGRRPPVSRPPDSRQSSWRGASAPRKRGSQGSSPARRWSPLVDGRRSAVTKTLRLTAALIAAVGIAMAGAALRAQETRAATLLTTEHWLDWERVNDAQISPDGSRIVYTRQTVNQLEDKWESSLWILNADGSQHRFLVKGSGARWSPDGKRLMYLADGEPKGAQLFVRWV